MITFDEELRLPTKIAVIGIGGAGINVTNRMVDSSIRGIEIIAADTDMAGLRRSAASIKFEIGTRLTKGMHCYGNPHIGRNATLEETDRILELLKDFNMVFLVGGEGGGTFTGAAPVFAGIASQMGILAIGVFTMPFEFQGMECRAKAEQGRRDLSQTADSILALECDSLFNVLDQEALLEKSLQHIDAIMFQGVLGISEIALKHGVIPLQSDDLRALLQNKDTILLGTGLAGGPNCAVEAVQRAIANPLIGEMRNGGAKNAILNIVGSRSMLKLKDTQTAAAYVKEKCGFEQVIVGAMYDETMGDNLRVTFIATDTNGATYNKAEASGPFPQPESLKDNLNPIKQDDASYVSESEIFWEEIDKPAFHRLALRKKDFLECNDDKIQKI